MSYYDEEFYTEPSEFDIQMEEFKANIMKSVKEEFVAKMERLEKENNELQEVRKNFEQIKKDYQQKEYQLNVERKNLEGKVRKEKLSNLLQDFQLVMYRPISKRELPPKCDKCDDKRKIKFKTPLGRDTSENCSCNEGKYVYHPEEFICYEFKLDNYGSKLDMWYKIKPSTHDGEYGSYDYSTYAKVVYGGQEFETLSKHETFFKDEENCQRYCDYLNAKEE